MHGHPSVIFSDGATGRRAGLIGGPDVWEVVRAVRSARRSEPDLDADEVIALVSTNTGVPTRLIDSALRYCAAYPAEIDARITDADSFEAAHAAHLGDASTPGQAEG